MKEADGRYNEEAVSVDQVSVNSADPLHSTFRGNYEHAFGVVMFESVPGRIAGLQAPQNTCLQR